MDEKKKNPEVRRKEAPEKKKKDGERAVPPSPAKGILAWVAILSVFLLMLHVYKTRSEAPTELPYSPDFIAKVEAGEVKTCEIVKDVSGDYIKGELVPKDGAKDARPETFKVYITGEEDIQQVLKNVPYKVSYHRNYEPIKLPILRDFI